jgi:hypothetical protein
VEEREKTGGFALHEPAVARRGAGWTPFSLVEAYFWHDGILDAKNYK